MIQRVWAIIRKEMIQLLRDRRTLFILFLTPLLQLLLYGYVVHMNINHIPAVVVDQSMDTLSRSYLDDLQNSGYFDIVAAEPDQASAMRAIDAVQARVGIIIPPQFAEKAQRGNAQVLILVDGSDMFTSQSAFAYANLISSNYAITLQAQTLARQGLASGSSSPLDTHVIVLYNPDMKDLWFIIPGMIAILLQQQSILLTAMAVARERETGTLEQILVTPIRPLELMLGKITPNILLAMLSMLMVVTVGVWWFKMPFQGSLPLFILLSLLFAFCGLGLGLLISTVSQTQRQAQQMAMSFTMIGLMLGGQFFPRYSMPKVVQAIGSMIPVTYFVPIARGVISKGVGLEFLWWDAISLLIYAVIVMTFAARSFRQKLE